MSNDGKTNDFLHSLLQGDRRLCSQIIHEQVSNKLPIKDLYEDLLKNSLYKVGELWEHNKISVATEHLASAIVEAILNELYPSLISKAQRNKTVIVSCVENETHQIGLKMVSDIFELNGWNSHFLGANTPTNELISFIELVKPDMLALSMSIYFHLPIFETMINKIQTKFSDLPIIVGGQGLRNVGHDVVANYQNVKYLSNLYEIETFINK